MINFEVGFKIDRVKIDAFKLVVNPGWNVKKPLAKLRAVPKACDDFNGGP